MMRLRKVLSATLGPVRIRMAHLRRSLDESAGRQIFGNTAGLYNNWVWSRGVLQRKMRRAFNGRRGPSEVAARLSREGFAVFGSPCAAEGMGPLAQKFASMIEDDRFSLQRASAAAKHRDLFFSRILKDGRSLLPELAAVFDDDLYSAVTGYFCGDFEVQDVLAWRNYGPPADMNEEVELFSDYWHCDRIPATTLKYFVLLEPVEETKGPLQIQNRVRTGNLVRKHYIERGRYNLPAMDIEAPPHVMKLTGPLGMRALCNTVHCLHRAGRPRPGVTRDILQVQFRPAARPFDINRLSVTSAPSLTEKYRNPMQQAAPAARDADV